MNLTVNLARTSIFVKYYSMF